MAGGREGGGCGVAPTPTWPLGAGDVGAGAAAGRWSELSPRGEATISSGGQIGSAPDGRGWVGWLDSDSGRRGT
jgi:hypothetical protein